MKFYYSIVLLFVPMLVATAQQNENEQHLLGPRVTRIGLVNVQLQNKADMIGSNTMVGANSLGVKLFKRSESRLIPFSVDIIVDKRELKNTYQYDVSAFATGFSDMVNDRIAHEVRFDLLNFDRERFRENGAPIIVDRFKLLDVKYNVMITVIPHVFKITLSGKLSPLQSTRHTATPEDLQQLMIDKTGDANIKFYSADKDSTTFKQVFGSGLRFQNDHQTSVQLQKGFSWKSVGAAGEAFLGDSEFSIGVMLFNFLEAKLSYAMDGVQTSIPPVYGFNYHEGFEIDFLSYKTSLSAEVKLERLVPSKNILRHFVFFTEYTKEKSYLSIGDLSEFNKIGLDYETDKTHFKNQTVTAGVRFTFLKPYKKSKPKPNANFTISRD